MGTKATPSQSIFFHSDKNSITGYGLEYLADLPKHSLEVLNLSMSLVSHR